MHRQRRAAPQEKIASRSSVRTCVIFGSLVVATGKRAGVMRFRWPEETPPPPGDPTAGLHPMLYSLDVFVPFVNLHQENYW